MTVTHPAAAYEVMVDLLDLVDPDYFHSDPPTEGVQLGVRGRDGRVTWWPMTPTQAAVARNLIDGDIRVVLHEMKAWPEVAG